MPLHKLQQQQQQSQQTIRERETIKMNKWRRPLSPETRIKSAPKSISEKE